MKSQLKLPMAMPLVVILIALWMLWNGQTTGTRPISPVLAAVAVVGLLTLAARAQAFERLGLIVAAGAFVISATYHRLGLPWWLHSCLAIAAALLVMRKDVEFAKTPWPIVLAALALIGAILFWV